VINLVNGLGLPGDAGEKSPVGCSWRPWAAAELAESGPLVARAGHLLGRAAIARLLPQLDAALAHTAQALTLAEEVGLRPLAAHCHLGLGRLYRRAGKGADAQAHLASAAALYSEMDMRAWLREAEAEAGDSRA
jgi:hypothetical protein